MGERKVIQKYYPVDFDPTKIPRVRREKNAQHKVRMMVPMSIRCTRCGNYIYKGTKFNARKETVTGEEYLGIKIFRFYFRCSRCSQEITIKTDPRNADYTAELGCTRNFEMKKEQAKELQSEIAERQEEERGNTMKQLENKTMDSRREMEILDALDELRSHNARLAKLDAHDLLEGVLLPPRSSEDADDGNVEIEDEDDLLDGLDAVDIALLRQMTDEKGASFHPVRSSALAKNRSGGGHLTMDDGIDDEDEMDGDVMMQEERGPIPKPPQQQQPQPRRSLFRRGGPVANSTHPSSTLAATTAAPVFPNEEESPAAGGLVDYSSE